MDETRVKLVNSKEERERERERKANEEKRWC